MIPKGWVISEKCGQAREEEWIWCGKVSKCEGGVEAAEGGEGAHLDVRPCVIVELRSDEAAEACSCGTGEAAMVLGCGVAKQRWRCAAV